MESEHPSRSTRTAVAELAKGLGTAVLSLALGTVLCLGLLLGGTALAAG